MVNLLGKLLRDTVSGFTGIAYQRVELLTGCVQYSLQPKGDGNTIPDAHAIDDIQLTVVDDSPEGITLSPEDPSIAVFLGDEVEDVVTGFVGVATLRTTFLNGCVYFEAVQKQNDAHDGKSLTLFAPHQRWKVVKSKRYQALQAEAQKSNQGILAKLKAALTSKPEEPSAEQPKTKPPGGPMSKPMRAC